LANQNRDQLFIDAAQEEKIAYSGVT